MLQKWCRCIVLILVAILSGCAALEKQAGFEVQPKSSVGRQEPWHNLSLMGDVRSTIALSVAYVPFPQPLPRQWKEELIDAARMYTVIAADGKQVRKPLERVVFRALAFRESGVEMFDAVLNPSASGFFILFPASAQEYVGTNLALVLSDGVTLMTTQGEMVNVVGAVEKLSKDFFTTHPSPLTRVVTMGRSDPNGKNFFTDLEKLFPTHFKIEGRSYSGRPDTKLVLAEFTKVEEPLDKLVSCGAAPIGPGMALVGVGIAVVRNAYIVSKQDCFK